MPAGAQDGLERAQQSVLLFGERVDAVSGNVGGLYGERMPPGIGRQATPVSTARLMPAAVLGKAVKTKLAALSPGDARRLDLLARLEERVDSHGASEAAVQEAKRLLRMMLRRAEPGVLERLLASRAEIEIIPRDHKLTDLPHFLAYRGMRTFDGRLWDEVRGMGNAPWLNRAGVSCAVAEENLLGGDDDDSGYASAGFLFVHEFSHLIHFNAIPGPGPFETSEVKIGDVSQAYLEAMKRPGKTGLGRYADSSAQEAFAEGVAAYFSVSETALGPAQLRQSSPELYAVIERLFGPAQSPRRG